MRQTEEALVSEPQIDACPTCERGLHYPSDHHLVPKSRGGGSKHKVLICRDCHDVIHALFSNKQLEKEYDNVDALMNDERFQKAIRFLKKQDPTKRTKTKRAKKGRGKGN